MCELWVTRYNPVRGDMIIGEALLLNTNNDIFNKKHLTPFFGIQNTICLRALFYTYKLKPMAHTFSQIYVHVVFSVKGRHALLHKPWRNDVFRYMADIINAKGQKSIIVNGVEDHVHLFIGLKPSMSVSDLIREVKNNTTNFINSKKYIPGKFAWQEGFGAFTYSNNEVRNVYQYIHKQEDHHKKVTFREEYLAILNSFGVEYDETRLFDWDVK